MLFFWVLKIWDVDLPIGREVIRTLIEILAVVLVCYVAWGLINAAIMRRMRKEMPEDDMDDEKEEGGAGGSRVATLLLLLRKFMLVVIIIMAGLIVLSALGVNIGPLISAWRSVSAPRPWSGTLSRVCFSSWMMPSGSAIICRFPAFRGWWSTFHCVPSGCAARAVRSILSPSAT